MSTVLEGVIGAVSKKANYGFWGFKFDGTEEWINVPEGDSATMKFIQRGNAVKVSVVAKGKKQIVEKIKLTSAGAAPAAATGGSTGGVYADVRGPAIQWQHSQEMAVRAADLLLREKAYKLGAESKPQERYKQIVGLIDDLTVKFYQEIATQAPVAAREAVATDLGDGEKQTDIEDATGPDVGDGIEWDND